MSADEKWPDGTDEVVLRSAKTDYALRLNLRRKQKGKVSNDVLRRALRGGTPRDN
jgi:hypothetical protein